MTNDPSLAHLPASAHHLTHRIFWSISLIVAAILIAVVVMQNWGDIKTPVLFMTVSMPRGLLMVLLVVAGFVLGECAAHYTASTRPKASRT